MFGQNVWVIIDTERPDDFEVYHRGNLVPLNTFGAFHPDGREADPATFTINALTDTQYEPTETANIRILGVSTHQQSCLNDNGLSPPSSTAFPYR